MKKRLAVHGQCSEGRKQVEIPASVLIAGHHLIGGEIADRGVEVEAGFVAGGVGVGERAGEGHAERLGRQDVNHVHGLGAKLGVADVLFNIGMEDAVADVHEPTEVIVGTD